MGQSNGDTAPGPPPLPARLLPVFALCFAALCANLSWIQGMHDGDSILLAFISIDRYLPFYWADNRYGMLVPWLARFIEDYRLNLLFQTQVTCLAAFAAVAAANAWFLEGARGPRWRAPAVAALAAAVALCLFRPTWRVAQAYLLAHPYLISLALGLTATGLILRTRGSAILRFSAGALCLGLSLWINSTHALLFAGLMVLLPARESGWRAAIRARLAGLLLTGVLTALVMWAAAEYPSLGGVKLAKWSDVPVSISKLWANTLAGVLDPSRLALLALVLCAAVGLRWWTGRIAGRWADELVFILVALAFALTVACTDWVVRNAYEPRYWTAAIVLIVIAAASWLAGVAVDWFKSPPAALFASAAALIAASLLSFGVPSLDRALAGIDNATSRRWDQVQRLGCTHMIGSYNQAWSSAFYARAHGAANPRYAVTSRSEVTQDAWSKMPDAQRKYCGVCDDFMNFYFRVRFELGDIRQTGRDGDLCRLER